MKMRALVKGISKFRKLNHFITTNSAKMSTSEIRNAKTGSKAIKERLVWVDLEVSSTSNVNSQASIDV